MDRPPPGMGMEDYLLSDPRKGDRVAPAHGMTRWARNALQMGGGWGARTAPGKPEAARRVLLHWGDGFAISRGLPVS